MAKHIERQCKACERTKSIKAFDQYPNQSYHRACRSCEAVIATVSEEMSSEGQSMLLCKSCGRFRGLDAFEVRNEIYRTSCRPCGSGSLDRYPGTVAPELEAHLETLSDIAAGKFPAAKTLPVPKQMTTAIELAAAPEFPSRESTLLWLVEQLRGAQDTLALAQQAHRVELRQLQAEHTTGVDELVRALNLKTDELNQLKYDHTNVLFDLRADKQQLADDLEYKQLEVDELQKQLEKAEKRMTMAQADHVYTSAEKKALSSLFGVPGFSRAS